MRIFEIGIQNSAAASLKSNSSSVLNSTKQKKKVFLNFQHRVPGQSGAKFIAHWEVKGLTPHTSFLPPSLLLPPLTHATHSNPVITTNLRIIIKNYLKSLCLQKNYNFYAGLASCNFSELKWFWGAEHKTCCTARSGTLQLRKGAISVQWWWASNWPQFVCQNHKPNYHMNCRYHKTVLSSHITKLYIYSKHSLCVCEWGC